MKSIKSRKQRKELFNAPLYKKRKWIAAHLEENLLLKYDKRAIPVVEGDTVKVMRGSFKGHEDKVAYVNVKKRCVEIEGLTMTKADGKKIAKPMHSSNLLITKLNLTDKWRRKKLERGLSEETRKEIEKEAEGQIKEVEEEQKKKVEEEKEEEIEEELPEEPEPEAKPVEKKIAEKKPAIPKKKPVEKKAELKPKATAKKEGEKPSTTKKKATPTKKKTAKKTPAKPAAKKKEDKK